MTISDRMWSDDLHSSIQHRSIVYLIINYATNMYTLSENDSSRKRI